MDQDYYPSAQEEGGPPAKGPEKSDKPDSETALLPKTIFGDKPLEPGSKCEFEIVHVYDDEVEVAYAHDEKSEQPSAPMEQSEGELSSMAQG